MQPSTVQKHGSQQWKEAWPERAGGQRSGNMNRDDAELVEECGAAGVVEREFKKKNDDVERQKEICDEWSGESGSVVAQRDHSFGRDSTITDNLWTRLC